MVWILTALMMVSMFGQTALAEEQGEDYIPIDTYVLNYSNQTIAGYENWDAKRLWDTPYRTNITVEYNPVSGEGGLWNYCTSSVLNMIDTGRLDPVGNPDPAEPYASIPVYCIDATTNGVTGFEYERRNLEDSDYFDDTVAGRVRAIFMHSFPYIQDLNVITAAVNEWNAANGSMWAEVQELNKYEVISATQAVIWTITNNGHLAENCYVGLVPESRYGSYYIPDRIAESVYHGYVAEGNTEAVAESEFTANNINAVARYLEALEPMGPNATLLSDTSFENVNAAKVQNADGTFTLTVSVKVVVDANASSNLKLTLVLNDKVYETVEGITATGEYTFVIPGIMDEATVKLAIDGAQSAGDVYLFNPVGGRHESQTMAGYDSSEKPVHAEIVIDHNEHIDNAISITKIATTTEKNSEDQDVIIEHPLYGIEFEVYYVCDMDTYHANLNEDGSLKEEALAAKRLVATMTTDDDGKAFCDVTLACKNAGIGNANGVFQVVEKEHPAIATPAAPVLVILPYPAEVEGVPTTVYTAELKLNNEVKPAPGVNKDVQWIDNNRLSVNADAAHTWIIRGQVPADMAGAEKYVITDTLDHRLSYIPESLVVKAGAADSEAGSESLTLTKDAHYTLDVELLTNDEGHGVDRLTVSLTEEGRRYVGSLLSNGGSYEVRVYFDAKIDANGAIDTEIPNQADLTYTNSVGFAHDTVYSDIPYVFTRGLSIYKYDAANAALGLEDATFKVARLATEAEINAGISEPLVMSDGQTIQICCEMFYIVEDWTAEDAVKVDRVSTVDGGMAMVYGLAEGEYFLVEVKAPAGYNLMSHPARVSVNANSSQREGGASVPNSSTFELPATGGIGTVIFTVGGGLLMVAGAAILILKNKKAEDESEE